ncbi:MAG: magnesium transporter CorA family protein [Anaerolineae bacterium]|nr:magnesium transporter CorA family protein [Anaerolineae bacterium]
MHVIAYQGYRTWEPGADEVDNLLHREDVVLWLDMTGPTPEEVHILREVLRMHPLAIEQVLDHKQRPKVEEYADHLFAIMNSANMDGIDVQFRELDIFVQRQLLVTVHRFEEPGLLDVRRLVNDACATKGMTTGYLLYTLVQVIVDSYFPVLDRLEAELDELEDKIIQKPSNEKLARLFHLKRVVSEIWRIAGQQRDMFSLLMRDESPYINQTQLRYYLRDVYDHLLRIYDNANAVRENVVSAVDLFFSAQSQQLNFFVNRLTLATIALGVLSVITGFFGMNFEVMWPVSMDEPYGVFFVVVVSLGVLGILWFVLQRQRQP